MVNCRLIEDCLGFPSAGALVIPLTADDQQEWVPDWPALEFAFATPKNISILKDEELKVRAFQAQQTTCCVFAEVLNVHITLKFARCFAVIWRAAWVVQDCLMAPIYIPSPFQTIVRRRHDLTSNSVLEGTFTSTPDVVGETYLKRIRYAIAYTLYC